MLIAASLLAVAVTTPSMAAPSPAPDEVARILDEEGLAGAVWSTVGPSGAIDAGAAGLKDARRRQRLAPEDRVHIGSVTKTLLAAGVLRLATEGRLSLDDPVSKWLPDAAIENRWAATHPVRVRHLLDHTSGLDDLRLWQFFSLQPTPDTPLARAFAGRGLLQVRSRPGARFSYSNMGYTLLGRVVEAATAERYEHYLDAHLLRPLGLHDSTFRFVTQQGEGADTRLAMGHFDDGTAHAAVPIYLRPAGQFTTTARDMGRFARFLMGDGRLDGEVFIDAHWLRALGRPAGTEGDRAGLRVGYGLGMATRDRNGAVGRCHGGNIIGYRAMLCLFPDRQRAYFWSVNSDSETADYNRLDALFVEALAVATPPRHAAAPRDAAAVHAWDGWYVPAPNRMATFEWVDIVFGAVRVQAHGAGLRLRPVQGDAVALEPVGDNLFRAPGRAMASHAVLRASDGSRVLTTGLQSYRRTSFLRLAALWASLVAGVAGLAWLLVSGVVRLLGRRLVPQHPVFVPVLGILALLLPAPFLLAQPFLQMGDLTVASGLLAGVTAALPLAMLVGLSAQWRRGVTGAIAVMDGLSMLAALQWAAVLMAWGLLPLRLWA